MNGIVNFVRFTRPHTIIGTTLSIVVLYMIAISVSAVQTGDITLLLLTLLSCLGSNVFIVGLNQLTDIEIDKINKPYLPLASGAYSISQGRWIIGVSVVTSVVLAVLLGPYLLATVILSLLLGTAYSLPPFRLKRFYFWAAFCIIAVRGLIVNLLLFLHFNSRLNGSAEIAPLIWTLTAVIFVYSIVIAWFKDMPDTSGDRTYGISTLSIHLGTRQVYRVGNILLGSLYAAMIALPYLVDLGANAVALSSAHILFACLLALASRRVTIDDKASLFQYYQFIWLLFFMEYVAFGTSAV